MADPRRPRLIGYLNELDVTGPSAVADDLLAHLDVVDPLRALLADEGQALEVMAAAWANGHFRTADVPEPWAVTPEDLRARRREAVRPVLAALREVAGLTHCAACHRPLPHTAPELAACQTAREVPNGG